MSCPGAISALAVQLAMAKFPIPCMAILVQSVCVFIFCRSNSEAVLDVCLWKAIRINEILACKYPPYKSAYDVAWIRRCCLPNKEVFFIWVTGRDLKIK